MAKQKPHTTLRTFGIYSKWNGDAKDLPDFQESTTRIPAVIDIEFGLTVNIVGGKNLELEYCIDHPGIRDPQGQRRPPFTGSVFVKTNDWDFYLGDTIWDPIEDKIGPWRMSLELQKQTIAEVTFDVYRPKRPLRRRYRLVYLPRPDLW